MGIFQWLSAAMQQLVTFFYNLTISFGLPDYGIAIILLTILIKMVLYPFTAMQVKSMKAVQAVAPRVEEIKRKYKDKPERMNKEIMDLYQRHNVKPLAGCLPVLVQMPFLIALFYALRDYQYVNDPSFLWIPALGQPDPFYILPILSGVTTYIMQRMTTVNPNDPTQRGMLIFMPIFMAWITVKFPSGLALYWVVGNIIQTIQQYFLYKPVPVKGES